MTRPHSTIRLVAAAAAQAVLWAQVSLVVIAAILALAMSHRTVLIAGRSMEPNLHRGSVLLTVAATPDRTGPGAIAVFRTKDATVTHRIAAANLDGTFVSKGDANLLADSTPLRRQQIDGIGRLVVPWIGLPKVWLTDRNLVALFVWLAASMACVALGTLPRLDRSDDASAAAALANEARR